MIRIQIEYAEQQIHFSERQASHDLPIDSKLAIRFPIIQNPVLSIHSLLVSVVIVPLNLLATFPNTYSHAWALSITSLCSPFPPRKSQ